MPSKAAYIRWRREIKAVDVYLSKITFDCLLQPFAKRLAVRELIAIYKYNKIIEPYSRVKRFRLFLSGFYALKSLQVNPSEVMSTSSKF